MLKRDGTKVKIVRLQRRRRHLDQPRTTATRSTDPTKVDIDHMVPLANAWRSGADAWTDEQREDFANDLDRPAAGGGVRGRRTGQRATRTRPPGSRRATGYWCEYAQDWIAVKSHWKLTVTTAEKAALTDMLESADAPS